MKGKAKVQAWLQAAHARGISMCEAVQQYQGDQLILKWPEGDLVVAITRQDYLDYLEYTISGLLGVPACSWPDQVQYLKNAVSYYWWGMYGMSSPRPCLDWTMGRGAAFDQPVALVARAGASHTPDFD